MQITTKKGDLGLTDINGKRIYKSDIVIDCIGEIDTLMAKCITNCATYQKHHNDLRQVVEDCTTICSYIAGYIKDVDFNMDVVWIENLINMYEKKDIKFDFVYPFNDLEAASYNELRALARSTERTCFKLHQTNSIDINIIKYFNRLSDLFFLMIIEKMHYSQNNK